MDVDAYVAVHRHEWERLRALVRRRRLTGAEVDELVVLYQRAATHLSVVRSASPDPALVGWLSSLVAAGRGAVTSANRPAWRELAAFVTAGFPAAVYLSRRWSAAVAVAFLGMAWLVGAWVAGDPEVQASIAAPDEIRRLVEHDFEDYYSANPATSFAAQVWTNNAWVSALVLVSGILIVPVVWILWTNALNLGVSGGLMAAHGRLDVFFGLITPHGLLELTVVFVAAGAGLRLGWTAVDPGPLRRTEAVARQGRATVGLAMGLTGVLLVSGVIEAFVTPSGLSTWARIGIGVLAEAAFLGYVALLGRRAVRAGETGDLAPVHRGDSVPVAGPAAHRRPPAFSAR